MLRRCPHLLLAPALLSGSFLPAQAPAAGQKSATQSATQFATQSATQFTAQGKTSPNAAPPQPASQNEPAAQPRPATQNATISAQPVLAITPPPAGHNFPANQTLVYTAEWRLFDAGRATLRLEPAGRELRVLASADASGYVSLLYHVHDTMEAFFDPRTFCTLNIAKHTEEGRRRLDTSIVFDRAKHKSQLSERNWKDGGSKTEEHDIPDCVTDVISAVYYIASLPLAPSATYSFPLNDGGKTAQVDVAVEAREEIALPAGNFKAVRVRVSSKTGKLKDRGQIWIWYTDAGTRLPVQMKARLFWGTLLLRLEKNEASIPGH